MTDGHGPRPTSALSRIVATLLALMAVLGTWDLLTDGARELNGPHGLIDVAFVAIAALSAWLLGRGWLSAERSLAGARASLADVNRSLAHHRRERDAWRERAQSLLRGLGEALDRQFGAWGLTPAEKETALLLLKGFSHKEVASLTQRSERTVRQHAIAVYRKSGLAGRAELAAFFFEDMLLPAAEPSAPPPEPPAAGS
ncbi:MAG: LuxR C-terminal-related transcriptional regulator [Candidatus Eisenbacteria bacterium]